MNAINNFALTGFNGVLKPMVLDKKMTVSVPANTEFSAAILVFEGDVDLQVVLSEEQAKCSIKIVYLSNKNNKNKINVKVMHQSKNTVSEQLIRGVLTDSATTDFNGKIQIPQNAQKCDGAQNHRAILLSDKARVRATPELEIYADDVKCSHGSAIGPIDNANLFYLMARGIPEKQAKQMLIQAFLSDILPDEWHNHVVEWMAQNV